MAKEVTAEGNTAAKSQLIDTGSDEGYVRRNTKGRLKESEDGGKSRSRDRKRKAKTKAKPGQGDKGNRSLGATTTCRKGSLIIARFVGRRSGGKPRTPHWLPPQMQALRSRRVRSVL